MPANDVTLESQWTENDADYTAYDAAVKAAQAKQAESDYAARYTEESRNALAAALAADVSGKKYTQQGEVDAATTAINNAVAGLDKMTYNAIFTVDGEEYAKVPTRLTIRSSLPRIRPRKATPSQVGNPQSALWVPQTLPSRQCSQQQVTPLTPSTPM